MPAAGLGETLMGAGPFTVFAPNDDAIARCAAYADADANAFFVPGLTDNTLIRPMCEASALEREANAFYSRS